MSKQDGINPKYGSRLVVKEARKQFMPELYVATPQPERLRAITSSTMNTSANDVVDADPVKLMTCDISRANFDAPAVRFVYVKVPEEDWETGGERNCGKLNVSMYGARGAALNWHNHCTGPLGNVWLQAGQIDSRFVLPSRSWGKSIYTRRRLRLSWQVH